jgi:hypothetical protein
VGDELGRRGPPDSLSSSLIELTRPGSAVCAGEV